MNYAEIIGHWYLRLNGFFVLQNFVIHRCPTEQEIQREREGDRRRINADVDMLAIRLPDVYEKTGGQDYDWDHETFNAWGIDLRRQRLCLVVEVKSAAYTKFQINKAFGVERLKYVLPRFGIVKHEIIEAKAAVFQAYPHDDIEGWVVGKVLIHDPALAPSANAEDNLALTPCHKLSIHTAFGFIKGRMKAYKEHKGGARFFFNDPILQLLAWEAGVELELPEDKDSDETDDDAD